MKTLCCKCYHQEGEKATHRMGENIFKSFLIENLHPEYIKNSQLNNKKTTQLEDGQRI